MQTTALPSFEPAARCAKCGGDEVSTRFCRGWTDALYGWPCHAITWEGREHLDRSCRRCGYRWLERTVDD